MDELYTKYHLCSDCPGSWKVEKPMVRSSFCFAKANPRNFSDETPTLSIRA